MTMHSAHRAGQNCDWRANAALADRQSADRRCAYRPWLNAVFTAVCTAALAVCAVAPWAEALAQAPAKASTQAPAKTSSPASTAHQVHPLIRGPMEGKC